MRKVLSFIIAISVVAAAERPTEGTLKNFFDALKQRSYASVWESYPLTCFPFDKGQSQFWTADCDGHYINTPEKRAVACLVDDSIGYFGSRTFIEEHEWYFYRAEKYCYSKGLWIFMLEYVIVTGKFGDIEAKFKREVLDGDFEKIK